MAEEDKELTDTDEAAETKAIEKWLRTVDKPPETKEEDKKEGGQEMKVAIVKIVR